MPFIPAVAAAGVTWAGIGTAVSVATAVVGLAGTVYSALSGPSSQAGGASQMAKYTPSSIPLPQMPVMQSADLKMPELPQVKQADLPPTPTENIIAPDQNQLKRMGQVRSAYFTEDKAYAEYKPERAGAMKDTTIEEDKSAITQVLGG